MPQTDQTVKFRDNGTVTCTVAGKPYRLRRPKLGEMRDLREACSETDEDVAEAYDPHRGELHQLREQLGAYRTETPLGPRLRPDLSDDEVAEARRLSREVAAINDKVTLAQEGARARWARQVFEVLGDRPLPDPADDDPADGLEAWMVGVELPVKLLGHWRSVPFDSGAAAATGSLELP